MRLDSPFVDLAEGESALRRGEYRRALTFSSRASQRLTSPPNVSRAALAAGRAAHLCNFRSLARTWFTQADIDGASPSTRLEALWGQFLVEDEENSGAQEEAAARFETASDGSVDHALRVSQARFMLGFGSGHLTAALAELERADALIPLASDPITVLASMNHKAWGRAASARYNEALEAIEHAKELAISIGIDFAIHYLSFPKAASLIGLRRFADASGVLARLAARVCDEPDGWATANLAIQNARLQISLGDLERAADHLALDPDEYQSPNLRAEFDGYRALIKAALGRSSEAVALAARARRWSRNVEGYAPSALARAIVAMDSGQEPGLRRAIVNYKLAAATGYVDAIVIACRARPDLATLIAQQGDLRCPLALLLAGSSDEPLARAAGLRVPRSTRKAQTLSPRELEVYELIAQGRTNREIAATLFISESTTKVHVRHILEKLGARSRVEAVQGWRGRADD
jgi:DNA-binding CsgD family transcriptional regulator